MTETQIRADWTHAVAVAPVIPIEVVLVVDPTIALPDLRGIDAQDRAILAVTAAPHRGFDPDGYPARHDLVGPTHVASGGRWSSAVRSARERGKPNTAEHRARISAALTGRPRPDRRTPIETRFWKYVAMIPFHTCGEWTGHLMTSRGGLRYGRLGAGGGSRKMLYAHRVADEPHRGAISSGMEIDHLCRNTGAASIPLTERRSHLKRTSYGAIASEAMRHVGLIAPAGHAYTPENLSRGKGGRKCRVCHRDRERARRAARAEARHE